MSLRGTSGVILVLLWSALVLLVYVTRPLLPVDETRYLAVAWEMWQRDHFLVPYLNGEPYSHKPPLLFWLFHSGWSLFGVNEWWPRLVSPLVSLVNLFLTAQLARTLWPEHRSVAGYAAWILFGSILWVALFSMVQFEQCMVCLTLLGLLGIHHGIQGRPRGWWLFGAALGLGVLCKGPVIFLYVLPAALLAPWWASSDPRQSWSSYYLRLLLGLALCVGIALAWAIPAGSAGGEAYRDAIFWHQTAGRTVNATTHRQPFWWYLPLLPLALLPWTLWPPFWKSMARLPQLSGDRGIRFCMAWFVPGLLIFSVISSKQLKYLLPLIPALALMAARMLHHWAPSDRWVRLGAQGAALIVAGVLLVLIPWLPSSVRSPDWAQQIPWGWGAVLLIAGVITAASPFMRMSKALIASTATMILLAGIFHLGVVRSAAEAYDLSTISARLSMMQRDQVPIANVAKYHGQFHFLGRLTQPLEWFLWDDAPAWMDSHPNGYLLLYYKQAPRQIPAAEYLQPYRGGTLVLWQAATLRANPAWLRTLPENQ